MVVFIASVPPFEFKAMRARLTKTSENSDALYDVSPLDFYRSNGATTLDPEPEPADQLLETLRYKFLSPVIGPVAECPSPQTWFVPPAPGNPGTTEFAIPGSDPWKCWKIIFCCFGLGSAVDAGVGSG